MKLSVIIPVKNGAETLERCLDSIRDQTITGIQIIVLDSGSTDNSNEIAKKFGAEIFEITKGMFNHGLTRNKGIELATGDFLFYTVQDAWLSQNDLLEKMMQHFKNDRVMGVVGHQAVPHEKDKNPMRWYKQFSESEVMVRQIADVENFLNLTQSSQQALISWDNVVAMYRKSALNELPFVKTEMSEDWIWCKEALLKGWSLVTDTSLVVYHYHHHTYRYTYKIAYSINYHFFKFFNFKPSLPDLVRPIALATFHLCSNKELTIKEKIYWIRHNYLIILGKFNSHFNFLLTLKIGGNKSIEKRYNKVCKTIPQGEQKNERTKSFG